LVKKWGMSNKELISAIKNIIIFVKKISFPYDPARIKGITGIDRIKG